MTLGEILDGVTTRPPVSEPLASRRVEGLDYDSRRIGKDFLFFAFPGHKTDGRKYSLQAVEQGALAVISELEAPGVASERRGAKPSAERMASMSRSGTSEPMTRSISLRVSSIFFGAGLPG